MQPEKKVDDLDNLAKLSEVRDWHGPYITKKGVKIEYNEVSSETIRRAWDEIPIPQPPQVFIEDRGRLEPNPSDPGYLASIDSYNTKRTMVVNTIYIMFGTEIASIPENIIPPDSEEWYEGLQQFISIPKGKLALKTAWLLHYILSDKEREEIIEDLMILSGAIPERKVQEAEDSFRSNGESKTDIPIQSIT